MTAEREFKSFEEFKGILVELLRPSNVNAIVPQASFIDDLYVDSIQLLELLMRIEELGVSVPVDAAWRIRTVGDAYDYYVTNSGGE